MRELDLSPLVDFAGIALGALLALLLWTARRANRAANRWLAAYVAALALLSAGDLAEDARWLLIWPHLAHLTDWLIFLVGPFLWMYVRRLTMHSTPSASRWLVHCIPAAICLILLVPFYVQDGPAKQAIVATELGDPSQQRSAVLLAAVAQVLAYWIASLWALRRFALEVRERFSSIEQRTFGWLLGMLAVNLAMWLLWLAGMLLRATWAQWLDVLAVPLGLYLLAFLGLRQPAVFIGPDAWRESVAPNEGSADAGSEGLQPASESQHVPERDLATPGRRRYARSGLDKARIAQYRQRLEELMNLEKPWLENDLTLTQLSQRAGIPQHHLSQVLNEELGQSFFDYVNAYRVREVQRCLLDPGYREQTVLNIALASGFNSKAAFNAVFRAHTGVTPSRYRRERAHGPN